MKLSFKILSVFLFSLVLTSCKKDKDVLNADVQPQDDALDVGFSETAPIFAHTLIYDSIESAKSQKYLGINKDPYFGTTEIGMYLNTSIPDGKIFVSFGEDANIVSSEIVLVAYNLAESFVGSIASKVSYSVFPLSTPIDKSKIYFTNNGGLENPNVVVGTFTGSYTTVNGKVALRIPIDKKFAASILNNPQYLFNNAAYQDTYKGFYIKCGLTNDEGVITRFDVNDALSGFYIYYQNGTPSATKVDKSFRFVFGGADGYRFNSVKQNFQGASNSLVQQVVNHDTTKGSDNLFLKGMGVSKLRLYIPSLKNYSDSFTVGVNRAEVIFNLDPAFSHGSGYTPPARLSLLAVDSLSREVLPLDQIYATDAARYDGKFDADKNRYVFNIAREVQAILTGKRKNNGFYLVVAQTESLSSYKNDYRGNSKEMKFILRDDYIERVVFAGSNNPSLKPVLNLSYVKFRHDQ